MTIDAILGKAALEKALQNSTTDLKPIGNNGQTASFQEMLEQQEVGQEMVELMDSSGSEMMPAATMQSIDATSIEVSPMSANIGLEPPAGSTKVVNMLSEVNKGQLQMDSLVNQILYSNKRFSNQELLAIQAHVFHFAQMTELTVKVAEQGVSSIKSIQNTQIQ